MKTISLEIVIFLVFLGNLFAQTGGSNIGTPMENEQKTQSTISVYGISTVLAQPDTVQITISLNKTDKTTQLAQQEVSRLVRRALLILKENDIEEKNISTTSFRFKPEYEYKLNRRVLAGQRAEQIITFSVDGINNSDEKASKIIDSLTQINGLELNQVSYRVKNDSEYYIKSRERAFQNAAEKARQYAELSMQKIKKVLYLTEENIQPMNYRSVSSNRVFYAVSAEAGINDSSTILPAGEIEITTRILVVFLLE